MGDHALRIYLAAPWKDRGIAAKWGADLHREGYTITRKWWDHDVPNQDMAGLINCAAQDIEGIVGCDVFVLCNWAKSEGKATELGIALTLQKRIIAVVGFDISNNIFLNLERVEKVHTQQELIRALSNQG